MSTTAPARTNRYPGKCAACSGWVPADAGTFAREGGKNVVRHVVCPSAAPAVAAAAQPDLGYYVRKDGAAIKVVASKSNPDRRYGLVFTPHAGKRPTWEYVKGAGYSVADLTPMTAGDAAALGLSHGHCIFCCAPLGGKTLSAHVSALVGYGETCAATNSLPYPKGVAAQRARLAQG